MLIPLSLFLTAINAKGSGMFDLLPLLSYKDLILAPLYFIILLRIAMLWKRKYYNNISSGRYIMPFFLLKITCCIILALLYYFYFGASDADSYFTGGHEIFNATLSNPKLGIELLFKPFQDCSLEAQQFAPHFGFITSTSNSTILICKLAGVMSLFCCGTYLPIAFIFTLFATIGTWRIFLVFNEEFPKNQKLVALGCLFAPSALLWGTNVLKDPICLFGLGLCITALYSFIKKRFRLANLIELIIGGALLLIIKDYIFYIFIIAALFSLYFVFIGNIKNGFIKVCIHFLLFITLVSAVRSAIRNADLINDMVNTNFVEATQTIQATQLSLDDGTASAYSIPSANNFSTSGIITTYFASLNVTLFRPYLWESKKPLVAANALESLAIFLLTIYLFIKVGVPGFFKFAFSNPMLLFSLVFTLLLAPLVGFVSFNFGTLCRYKLPMVPLFYTYLILLYASVKNKKSKTPALHTPTKNNQ
jgi:hypothetical protein